MPEPSTDRPESRPKNREVEYEDVKRPPSPGEPARPATEPQGAEASEQNPDLRSDPASGRN